jgi:predicted anti-sigma-YlaC factor YlaD
MKTAKVIPSQDMRARLSTLWIVVMINILSADVFSFMLADITNEAPVKVSQLMMLVFAIPHELPIAMIFLSRVLKPRANRLSNIIAGVVTILYVIAGGSLTPHYIFFAAVEISAMLLIIRYARMLKDADDRV